MMTPEHRLAAVLFGSAVLCLPALTAMAADEVEPNVVGVRYGISVALAWVVIRLVERIIGGYIDPDDVARVAVEAEASETPTHERRRATDAGDGVRSIRSDDDTQTG